MQSTGRSATRTSALGWPPDGPACFIARTEPSRRRPTLPVFVDEST